MFVAGIAKWYAEVQDEFGGGAVLTLAQLLEWLQTPVLVGGGSAPLCHSCTDAPRPVEKLAVQVRRWCQ